MARIKRFTPQEKAVYHQQKRAEINDLIKRINDGVQAVFESERYKNYLRFASNFTDYSARNTMLISLQKPHATFVASYGKWKKLGRQVKQGEKGIAILAPVIYDRAKAQETALDKQENLLFNGEKTVEDSTDKKTNIFFKKVYVYDVSQTSGKEIPTLADELTGDIDLRKKEAIFTALQKITGIDFEFRGLKGDVKGFYNHKENRIVIKSGMSDTQTLKTAFHETAHKLLHDPELEIVTVKSKRNEKEVQAESVAFMVAERLGLDTSEYSFAYIASWSNGGNIDRIGGAWERFGRRLRKLLMELKRSWRKLRIVRKELGENFKIVWVGYKSRGFRTPAFLWFLVFEIGENV